MPRRKVQLPKVMMGGAPNLHSRPPLPLSITVSIKDVKNADAIISRFIEEVRAIEEGRSQKIRRRANYGPNTAPTRELVAERLREGFDRWLDSFNQQLDREIMTPQFDWPDGFRMVNPVPRETARPGGTIFRRNGERVTAPINIVDTGYFLKSKSLDKDLPNLKATFKWDAPYAFYVFHGTRYMNGRDFVNLALNNVQPIQVFYGRRASNYRPR